MSFLDDPRLLWLMEKCVKALSLKSSKLFYKHLALNPKEIVRIKSFIEEDCRFLSEHDIKTFGVSKNFRYQIQKYYVYVEKTSETLLTT